MSGNDLKRYTTKSHDHKSFGEFASSFTLGTKGYSSGPTRKQPEATRKQEADAKLTNKRVSQSCAEGTSPTTKRGLASLAGHTLL